MNVVLEISYDGMAYKGWQVQPNKRTVQGEIQQVLYILFKKHIKIAASGRTDTGVSAIKQVANFHVETNIPANRIMFLLNDLLPLDIRITNSYEADSEFNARIYAKKKTYVYNFYFGQEENAYINKMAVYFKKQLNIEKMKEICKLIVGTHDFTSFCSVDSTANSKIRTIYSADITKKENFYQFEITGNGFLYNMIRIIMGTLLLVGYEKLTKEEFEKIFEAKDRRVAGKTVPANGLVLKNVEY